jgi:hypothetical protein
VVILAETDLAIMVHNDRDKTVWLPKSQVEIERRGGGAATITLPEWLAEDRELS